jgi:hypothetical protein
VDLNDFRLVGIERPTGTVRAELTMGTFLFRAEGAPPAAKPGAVAPGRPGSPAPPKPPVPPAAQPGKATR